VETLLRERETVTTVRERETGASLRYLVDAFSAPAPWRGSLAAECTNSADNGPVARPGAPAPEKRVAARKPTSAIAPARVSSASGPARTRPALCRPCLARWLREWAGVFFRPASSTARARSRLPRVTWTCPPLIDSPRLCLLYDRHGVDASRTSSRIYWHFQWSYNL